MGYKSDFISRKGKIELPGIRKNQHRNVCNIDYTHFSIVFSIDRMLPLCCAVNIDGRNFVQIKRTKDVWKKEISVFDHQIAESFYKETKLQFHKGHIVRRLDPCWGTKTQAKQAENDTFYYTNACPQHRKFNPKIWLELERAILEKGAVHKSQKISVFSGPILHYSDKPYIYKIDGRDIFIPSHFWKIVVWKKSNLKIYAVGFIQSQKEHIARLVNHGYKKPRVRGRAIDDYFENINFKNNAVYQVSIPVIEKIAGISFKKKGIIFPRVKNKSMELVVENDFSKAKSNDRFRSLTGKTKISISGIVLD